MVKSSFRMVYDTMKWESKHNFYLNYLFDDIIDISYDRRENVRRIRYIYKNSLYDFGGDKNGSK